MGRIIDADALKDYIVIHNVGCGCSEDYQKSFLESIDDQPTIDPDRKGYKINQHSYPAKWLCSECGAKHFDFSDKFCSECGVNVEEGEQDEQT